jgi:hypothetical protein
MRENPCFLHNRERHAPQRHLDTGIGAGSQGHGIACFAGAKSAAKKKP